MLRHDSPLVVERKRAAPVVLPKQHEEVLNHALCLSMIRKTEEMRKVQRALQHKEPIPFETKRKGQFLEESLMFEPDFVESIERGIFILPNQKE